MEYMPRRIKPGVLSARPPLGVAQASYVHGNCSGRAALAFAVWEGASPGQAMLYESEAWRAGCTFAEAALWTTMC